ncbi:MAG: cytochrome P450, partial [Acidimicrobiales bacterium]
MATATATFDLLAPDVLADPYPHYARLRDAGPVHYLADVDLWVVTRYDDVQAVLRDHERYSSDLRRLTKDLAANPFNPTMKVPRALRRFSGRLPWPRVLLTSDPPAHTVLRRKISKAFTPRMIGLWEPRVRGIAERLATEMVRAGETGSVDLVRDFAAPLPSTVIAELMGIPSDRQDDFRTWSDNLVNALTAGGSVAKMVPSAIRIELFFARVVRQRRKQPGDDLISLLMTGDKDTRLTFRELVTFCILLLAAGNETTSNLVANAVLALFAHPDAQRLLEADPSRAAALVEETLRYDSPAQGLLRVTTTDVAIGGTTVPPGSKVLPLVGSANRDPDHWPDPDRFSLDRDPNDHLSFGTGIHFCIGNQLARLEARVALETLFRHYRGLQPAGAPERITSPVLRGVRSLPVRLRQSGSASHGVGGWRPSGGVKVDGRRFLQELPTQRRRTYTRDYCTSIAHR